MADDGWVRIPPPSYHQRLIIGSIWTFVAVYVGWRPSAWLGARLEEGIGGGWLTVAAVTVLGTLALASLVLLVITRITPGLDVDAHRGVLRLRGRERPFTDLVGARVEQPQEPPESRYDAPRKRARQDPLVLRLDLAGGRRFRIVLAIGPTDVLSPERAAALIAAVRGSRIEAPPRPTTPRAASRTSTSRGASTSRARSA
jgi:hypothetical protein